MKTEEWLKKYSEAFPNGNGTEEEIKKFCDQFKGKRIGDWMPCGHHLCHWRPLEGTIAGSLEFQKDPEKHGFCYVCYAVEQERRQNIELVERLRSACVMALDAFEALREVNNLPSGWDRMVIKPLTETIKDVTDRLG